MHLNAVNLETATFAKEAFDVRLGPLVLAHWFVFSLFTENISLKLNGMQC